MTRKIGVVLFSLVVAWLAPPVGAQAQSYLPADEAQTTTLLNASRGDAGLQALPRHPALDEMAREQSVRMANQGSIYHNPNLAGLANAAGLDWRLLGENVGVGPNSETIHQAFLDSPPHYENIVNPKFTALGIGIVQGGSRIYITHVFAQLAAAPAPAPTTDPEPATTPASAPSAPVAVPVAPPTPATPDPTPEPTPVVLDSEPNALVNGVLNLQLLLDATPT